MNNPSEEFYRIKRLPPYVFAEVNRLKAKLRKEGKDIIDFGFGNPDSPTPDHIIAKLIETVQKPRTTGYSVSKGISGLRKSAARYYKRRFNVTLCPESEIIATIGSKEGFANLAQAITAPGDIIYAPNPSYPLHAYGFIICGGIIQPIEAISSEEYLAGLKVALLNADKPPLAIVVCFPSNPTGHTASLDFYKEIVKIAIDNNIIILSDLAYSEIYFDSPPPSIFEVEGAKKVAIETISLSKTYAMAGWRMGFVVGAKHLISALARVKSYLDYGAFTPIQVAACAALDGPQDCVVEFRNLYKERRDVLIESFERAGWAIQAPSAGMFVWAPLPEGIGETNSLEFSKRLMEEAAVAVSPGVGFGSNGEGYVRIGLVENDQRIRQAARNIKQFLIDLRNENLNKSPQRSPEIS
ncbi:aminotransferase class I/II-fold pyridoxal phosphate-dependent enzyme [Hellea sp.]|nr:aminotransferase class I/II-fold pyridoxal phosphate-dependent enzyme [Hellea sp.]MDA8888898.1 aminotransferase class I/II-fold pyridoxal phosphate-dependent enzyme [Hellea sp.]MDB4844474.1 aminotransferase class I/II-fold pyridoxal phosphate-dependent enzyme [Hellea sp.]MDC0650478.1 aminotransferase class I/II-fold pyridoxal phosphate-dependent enzyme [Hellea sp.]